MLSDHLESLGVLKFLLNDFLLIVEDQSKLDLVTEGLPGHACVFGIGIANLGRVEVATKDIGFNGDGGGCVQVVTGDHADSDASLVALLDGLFHSVLKGVLQAIEGHHCHVLCKEIDLVINFL